MKKIQKLPFYLPNPDKIHQKAENSTAEYTSCIKQALESQTSVKKPKKHEKQKKSENF